MSWLEERPLIAIFLFSVICMIPAFCFGISGFDAPIHGQWNAQFLDLLSLDNLRPTHAPEFFAGYGSYVFFLYPPLSFYLTALPMALLANAESINFIAISASAFLAVFVSGVTCYYWIKSSYSKKIALISALLYIALPQHLFSYYFNVSASQIWAVSYTHLTLPTKA